MSSTIANEIIETMKTVAAELESLEDFVPCDRMIRDLYGNLDLEHPINLGWLLSALFVIAESSVVTIESVIAKAQEPDGRIRSLEVIVPMDDDGKVLIGTSIATALVQFSKRGWARRFDESISSHSILKTFFENFKLS